VNNIWICVPVPDRQSLFEELRKWGVPQGGPPTTTFANGCVRFMFIIDDEDVLLREAGMQYHGFAGPNNPSEALRTRLRHPR